ncbi:hypothetical protein APA_4336 [Pseudanabaena sp. lw0831]|uniref:DUF4926 domain-containing protein n=1 Tax=Pseudanabaena sp. lw0831 TaxID=1357935 RepID=UPI00191615DC|nr:DUF4926 domain-containing protein [Pseudanabaena sp. lw0831]GBO52031.1 hypothetical protein APA_4336 [Pseudanabaena sp. lw0831]
MNFSLYSDVILLTNLPEECIYAGDIGTVVERHDVIGLETGYSVEFFDMLGNTVSVVTLPMSYFRLPTRADRPAIRLMASAA